MRLLLQKSGDFLGFWPFMSQFKANLLEKLHLYIVWVSKYPKKTWVFEIGHCYDR